MCAIGDDDNFISNSILLSGELQTIPCEVGIISGHAIKAPRNSIGPMIEIDGVCNSQGPPDPGFLRNPLVERVSESVMV
jgi:hypothetical protein